MAKEYPRTVAEVEVGKRYTLRLKVGGKCVPFWIARKGTVIWKGKDIVKIQEYTHYFDRPLACYVFIKPVGLRLGWFTRNSKRRYTV